MKLNIEELARESFGPEPIAYFGVYKEELEDFARLIVERCAVEASDFLTKGRSPHGQSVATAIRKLLESE